MINDEIREITRRFVDALHPEKVILFGSYAKNTERADSDYDFFIIMSDETEKEKNMVAVAQDAYLALNDMKERKTPVDVLAGTVSSFEDRSSFTTMERIVKREGVTVYDRLKERA